jgi:hypothetical protein
MNPVWRSIVVALAAVVHAAAMAAPPGCAIPGDVIWWIADDCMAKLQTDDEIPASACIAEQSKRRFADACAAKHHYKRSMCRRAKAGGEVESVERCVADPAFMGRTVRNRGVGR